MIYYNEEGAECKDGSWSGQQNQGKYHFGGKKTERKGWEEIHFWCLEGLKAERSTNVWGLERSTKMAWEGVEQKSWWGRQVSENESLVG